MNTSGRSSRLVSGVAVAAVSIAALGAVASTLMVGRAAEAPRDARLLQSQRPAADQPVRVVKAPADAQASRRPVGCRDCEPAPVLGGRL